MAALPGMPHAIAARPVAHPDDHPEMYSRAFMLPAIAATGTEQSLAIPQGWYHAGRLIDVYTNTVWRVKLIHLLDEGPDFEQVSFVIVG